MSGVRLVALSVGGLLLAGCIHLPEQVRTELQCVAGPENHFGGVRACTTPDHIGRAPPVAARRRAPSIAEVPYRTGQIILIERPGAVSLFLSLMAARYAPWIHAGVIVVDEGTPYVYEAFGTLMPRLSGSPTDGMRGGVRRVTLASFLKRDGIIAVHEPPAQVDREALAAFARHHEAQRTPFDGYFDSQDPTRLYCVEFVAHALRAGGANLPARSPVSSNRSASAALAWLKTAGPELLLAGDLVDVRQPVWQAARRYSPAQIESYFALKRELHRRFTPEQKLGNLLQWRWQSLSLRPSVQAYLDTGMAVDAPDAATLAARLFDGGVAPDARDGRMAGAVTLPGP